MFIICHALMKISSKLGCLTAHIYRLILKIENALAFYLETLALALVVVDKIRLAVASASEAWNIDLPTSVRAGPTKCQTPRAGEALRTQHNILPLCLVES
jgi:hypothetical protein